MISTRVQKVQVYVEIGLVNQIGCSGVLVILNLNIKLDDFDLDCPKVKTTGQMAQTWRCLRFLAVSFFFIQMRLYHTVTYVASYFSIDVKIICIIPLLLKQQGMSRFGYEISRSQLVLICSISVNEHLHIYPSLFSLKQFVSGSFHSLEHVVQLTSFSLLYL